MYKIIKKDNGIVEFDISKIILALTSALEKEDSSFFNEQKAEVERENYRKYVRVMAELDWPAFLERSPRFHREIISCVEAADMDEITAALYTHFGNRFLSELELRLRQSAVIHPKRLPALLEAILLYQRKHYYGAVAVLIPQIEGILSDIGAHLSALGYAYDEKTLDLLTTRYHVPSTSKSEKAAAIKAALEANDVDGVANEYGYLIGYLRTIVLKGELSEDGLAENPNRHAICHGRQSNYGTKTHALKVILCIDALEHISSVLTKQSALSQTEHPDVF